MEFFKGIELPDIIIACVGVTLTLLMLLSNLPFRWGAALIMFILFAASIIPVENEKAYKTVYYGIKYAMSYKTFRKNPEKKGEIPVQGITPFTGISGNLYRVWGCVQRAGGGDSVHRVPFYDRVAAESAD